MLIQTNAPEKLTPAIAALEYVMDPEIGLNVVDLGLIYSLQFDEIIHRVTCVMTLSTPHCPMGDVIISGVTRALREAYPEYTVDVQCTFDPPWDHDRISDIGKQFLDKYR